MKPKQLNGIDEENGLYCYSWMARNTGLRHTVFYNVKHGIVQRNVSDSTGPLPSPLSKYIGKHISEFVAARMSDGWQFVEDKLVQVTETGRTKRKTVETWNK